jgi:hypothetical protein
LDRQRDLQARIAYRAASNYQTRETSGEDR